MAESKKPTKAVALRYDQDAEQAPRVVARGQGHIAQRIAETAQAAGIPVREDPSLVEILVKLDVKALVPEEMYSVLAEVFAWAYRQDKRMSDRRPERQAAGS